VTQRQSVTHVLPIRPFLTINLQIPSKGTLKEGLVLGIRNIKLLVLVRLEIRGNIDHRLGILPTEDEDARDDGVVDRSEHTYRTEEVFSRGFQAVEEAADLVGRHEDLRELAIVLEVDTPDGEALFVEAVVARLTYRISDINFWESLLLVEPFDRAIGATSILVGIRSFPVVEDQGRFRK